MAGTGETGGFLDATVLSACRIACVAMRLAVRREGPAGSRRPGRPLADLRHLGRRVAELRRERRGAEVLAARADRCQQLRGPRDRLGMALRRPSHQPLDAGRRGVVGPARRHRRRSRRGDTRSLPGRAPSDPVAPAGHAADGGRRSLLQYPPVAGRRGRRDDRRDALGLQPQELRRGDPHDEQPLVAAGRRLLDRRGGG